LAPIRPSPTMPSCVGVLVAIMSSFASQAAHLAGIQL
jgi:hypothetical protein